MGKSMIKIGKNIQEGKETKANWTFDDVVAALRFIAVPIEIPISSFSIDSREIIPGQAFIALRGEKRNGHDFLSQAYENGAVMSLVEEGDLPALKGKSFLCVKNTHEALMDLAQYARGRTGATIVGVSGSLGKTTVKSWIAHLLSNKDTTISTLKNFNGHIGLPLSMTGLGTDTRFGVFEIGIDQPGTMQSLATLCNPHVAVLTPLAQAHIENFKSMESLAHEKAMLFSGLCPNGIVVVDQKSCQSFPILEHLAKEYGAINLVTVGFEEGATVRILDRKEIFSTRGTHVKINFGNLYLEYELCARGDHFILDSAMALAAAVSAAYEGDFESIIKDKKQEIQDIFLPYMNNLEVLPGRGQIFSVCLDGGRKITVIDDAYNANLSSMLSGLESLVSMPGNRRIAVVGDMLSLGHHTENAHKKLFEAFALQENIDKVYAVGHFVQSYFSILSSHKRGEITSNVEDLEQILKRDLQDGDVIWIKASNAIGLHQISENFRKISCYNSEIAA